MKTKFEILKQVAKELNIDLVVIPKTTKNIWSRESMDEVKGLPTVNYRSYTLMRRLGVK